MPNEEENLISQKEKAMEDFLQDKEPLYSEDNLPKPDMSIDVKPIDISIEDLRKRTNQQNIIKTDFDVIFKELKTCLEYDFTIEQSCNRSGISSTTFRQWCQQSSEFKRIMTIAKDNVVLGAKRNIAEAIINSGDIDTSKWLLPKKEKTNYSERQEVTGADGAGFFEKDPLRTLAEQMLKNEQSGNSKTNSKEPIQE